MFLFHHETVRFLLHPVFDCVVYMCTRKCLVLEVDALSFPCKVLGTPLFHQAKFFEKCSALTRY